MKRSIGEISDANTVRVLGPECVLTQDREAEVSCMY